MNKQYGFNKDTFKELDMLVPIVERVHGAHHPEFFEVSKVYKDIKEKMDTEKSLDTEFEKLRNITENYKVPGDVCETYEKIYKVLEELNNLYESK
ncbi:MAG: iron-sulfur cluster repair di-iron protein, ric [Lagierella massiliensis]|nr:iron-sulfur cluster repair di-iron protein, ric [Lagierella massiliensis]